MKILIVEDESKTARYLHKGLCEAGYVADVVTSGEAAIRRLMETEYALVILDVMLPGIDGWTVLGRLRQARLPTAVLLLTARDAVDDRVKGLELGADDYLVKPFAFSELLARVRAIGRRTQAMDAASISVGDLEIDARRHRAVRGGVRLDLTPKEFALLVFMAGRVGEVLSRTLISEQVWDMNFVSDSNVVDVHIRRLRAKVDEPFEGPLIHTVRGVGYVLEVRS